MADILKVSVPTSGYENSTRTNPITVNDMNIPNIVDPAKVARPDGQSGNAEQGLTFHYESNFDAFLTALRKNPDAVELFSQIFFQMGTIVESGMGENFVQELAKFLQLVPMTEGDLLAFLKNQDAAANKFYGAFFQQLQALFNQTKSGNLQREILQFLKVYNSVDASASTMQNMYHILENMGRYMPSSFRSVLYQLMEKLQLPNGMSAWQGASPNNIALLKKEIIPFLSNYIKQTNDLGRVRDMITLLTLNMAKYENGSMGRLVNSFQQLMSFRDFQKMFGNMQPDDLRQLLLQKSGQAYAEQFAEILQRGLAGEAGFEAKLVFQNIMHSLLLNESVYMPLRHFMIPANLMGQMMFSEVWVDPNHGKSKQGKGEESAKKLLIKFDIKDVGFFDMILLEENGNIDLQLFYPESFKNQEKNLQKDITGLIEKNGLKLRTALFAKSVKPKSISEVFPQIYERKNAVNVKI